MKIGMNLLSLIPGHHAGIYTHSRNLLRELTKIDHGHEIILFTNEEGYENLKVPEEYAQVKLPISGHSRVQRSIAEQILLPVYGAKEGVDILHSIDYLAPIMAPFSTTATIHDMNYQRVPEGFSWLKQSAMKVLVPLSVTSTNKVFTVSEFSKREVLNLIDIESEKLHVIPNALPNTLIETSPTFPSNLTSVKNSEYLLYVGTTHPHKNTTSLIEAVAQIDPVPPLVVCGPKRSDADAVERLAAEKGISDQVYLPGYVEDAELAGLYEEAAAYVQPSLYEGFGMPLLEVMYFETPAIASDIAAIPEVAGDAAVYFDPHDAEDMADKISRVIGDEKLQGELIDRGTQRLNKYSWEDSAYKLIRHLEQFK
jgi:glycosyltransferase involved in cell wall biosynthesis